MLDATQFCHANAEGPPALLADFSLSQIGGDMGITFAYRRHCHATLSRVYHARHGGHSPSLNTFYRLTPRRASCSALMLLGFAVEGDIVLSARHSR